MLPLLFILLATLASVVLAFGTDPGWAYYDQGLSVILLARRLQWPMIAAVVALAVGLLALVVSGRRRAVWLVGLLPVLGLFVYRFGDDPYARLTPLDDPPFVPAGRAAFVADDTHVVSLQFGEQAYAFPYDALYMHPVVFVRDHDRRGVLFWNAFADRPQAFVVQRDFRSRDLEVVSMPGNALLLYNARLGQFINALTATTPDGRPVEGLRAPLPTGRTTFGEWRAEHPEGRVLATPAPAGAPKRPIVPSFPLPKRELPIDAGARVTLVHTDPPLAVPAGRATLPGLRVDTVSPAVVLTRDPATHALEARTATNAPIHTEENLPYGVLQFWYPDLQLLP